MLKDYKGHWVLGLKFNPKKRERASMLLTAQAASNTHKIGKSRSIRYFAN
jgi:hypothetical protein